MVSLRDSRRNGGATVGAVAYARLPSHDGQDRRPDPSKAEETTRGADKVAPRIRDLTLGVEDK